MLIDPYLRKKPKFINHFLLFLTRSLSVETTIPSSMGREQDGTKIRSLQLLLHQTRHIRLLGLDFLPNTKSEYLFPLAYMHLRSLILRGPTKFPSICISIFGAWSSNWYFIHVVLSNKPKLIAEVIAPEAV